MTKPEGNENDLKEWHRNERKQLTKSCSAIRQSRGQNCKHFLDSPRSSSLGNCSSFRKANEGFNLKKKAVLRPCRVVGLGEWELKEENSTRVISRGGDSYMKQTGMLVVSLRGGRKFRILFSLRVFRAKRQYFKPPRSRLGFREETKNYAKRNRSQISNFLFFSFSSGLF